MRILLWLAFFQLTVIHTSTDDISIADNLCDDLVQSTQHVYFLVGQLVVLSQTNDFELLQTGNELLRYQNFRMTTVQLSKEAFAAFEQLDEFVKLMSTTYTVNETHNSWLNTQKGFQRLLGLIREVSQAVDEIYYDEFESLLNKLFQSVRKVQNFAAHILEIANRSVDSSNDLHALANSFIEFVTEYPTKRFFDTWSLSQKSRSELENDNHEAMMHISSICNDAVTDTGTNGIEMTTDIVETPTDDTEETVEIIDNGVIAILLSEDVISAQHQNLSTPGNKSYSNNSGCWNAIRYLPLVCGLQLLLFILSKNTTNAIVFL